MQPLIRFNQYVPLLTELAIDTAALIGFFFIFRGLVKLKIYGEMRSMMAPHARINQILLLLFTGSLLIYFPQAARTLFIDALFGTPVIKELPYQASHSAQEDMQFALKQIMQLMGHIALIRGIVQLGSYSEGSRHSLGKALTHIVAGACAINIQQTFDLLNNLVGVD